MKTYLEDLKNKPEHHRRKFALASATFLTAMIFVVWLSVLLPQNANTVVAKSEKSENKVTPFATLKNGVASVFEGFKDALKKTQESVNFDEEYNKIKNQVESGDIKITPSN